LSLLQHFLDQMEKWTLFLLRLPTRRLRQNRQNRQQLNLLHQNHNHHPLK
jgi:hypothetical protein